MFTMCILMVKELGLCEQSYFCHVLIFLVLPDYFNITVLVVFSTSHQVVSKGLFFILFVLDSYGVVYVS